MWLSFVSVAQSLFTHRQPGESTLLFKPQVPSEVFFSSVVLRWDTNYFLGTSVFGSLLLKIDKIRKK